MKGSCTFILFEILYVFSESFCFLALKALLKELKKNLNPMYAIVFIL